MSFHYPWLGAVADLNADSRSDIVLTTLDPPAANQLRVLLGAGAGSLAQTAAIPVAETSGTAVALVQDLDGDAHPDVLLGGATPGTRLKIVSGDGARGLLPARDATTSGGPRVVAMALADFNEDGRADLVVASPGVVTVRFGDGRGHFWDPGRTRLVADWHVEGVRVADFDGDRHQDLVMSGGDNGDVFVFLGTGTGTFHPATGAPTWPACAGGPRRRFACSATRAAGPQGTACADDPDDPA
jgi:hypothetical protein